eukprot:750396-Hanusia_phi.AAC.4
MRLNRLGFNAAGTASGPCHHAIAGMIPGSRPEGPGRAASELFSPASVLGLACDRTAGEIVPARV